MSRERPGSSRLLAIALLSALGLLGAGLVAVVRASRSAQERAAGEAERAALYAAQAVADRLQSRELVEGQPEERRFELKDGALVVNDALGWIDAPPVESPVLELPGAALQALAEAEVATREGRADVAAAAGDRAVDLAAAASQRARDWLRIGLAWAAEHRGDADARDRHVDEIRGVEPFRDVTAGVLLLSARAGREPPEWAVAAFIALPRERAEAVVARLEELGARDDLVARLATAAASADRSRETLRLARSHVQELSQLERGTLEEFGDDALLAYVPAAADAVGSGLGVVWNEGEVLGVVSEMLRQFERTEGAAELRPSWSAESRSGARVTRHLVIEPGPSAASGFFARQGLVLTVGGAMLACGIVLLLALRSLRRESLATQARAEFLTMVTHELKTPLASIRLFSEMLVEGRVADDERRAEYHRLLASESERLGGLIENVLDLGRMERGERSLDRGPQHIAELVRDVLDRFAPLAEHAGMVVEARLPAEPMVAALDRGAIAQALWNLLENARKYAAGGKRVVVELAQSTNGAEGSIARLTVRDFGPGVPESERESIFGRFERGAGQRDGSVAGLGLGLHLARSLVRAHGGDVRCEPPRDGTAERGAEFVVTLPLDGSKEAR